MGNNSIICVNRKQYQQGLINDHYWMGSLTIGKVYEIIFDYGLEFMIKNDYGFEHIYQKKCLKQYKNLDKKN